MIREKTMFRIGQGFDVHQFVNSGKLILGGIEIPYDKGLVGHSDADVLLHAVIDACLGAIAFGDIGKYFPDTDSKYKDANSSVLLQNVWHLVKGEGYLLGNLDCTIITEQPKLSPHFDQIRARIAQLLESSISQISVKATTTESLGFTGRGEGITALAVILLVDNR
jgi:2-C-methyl-D-erythritol 2,4-cyclodiphosphate synthase